MNIERIVQPNKLDQETDINIRPTKFGSFIGQSKSIDNLKIFIEAAKNRNEALDHTLLYGPPGLGKTTIAQIIAKEMIVNFRTTSGPILSKAGDLAAILTNLETNDVLFIDEIHRLNPNVEEILYSAMEDFVLDLIIGEGPAARTVRIELPKFTLVGATTRIGLLTGPLRDRFGIPLGLEFYNYKELVEVITRGAKVLGFNLEPLGAEEIARRSRGTPRIALRLLRRVRDFAVVEGETSIGQKITQDALKRLGVDLLGLDSNDHKYLRFIADHYNGGPVGIETIAAGLSEQRDTIEETIEPYLIQTGLIQRLSRGRMMTEAAFAHLKISLPKLYILQKETLSSENNN
jgi:holliday junction DNA helicase RuvB